MRPPRAAVTEAGEFNVDPISPPTTTTAEPPSPPPPPPKCDSHATCPWWPYSNSKDFGANAAVILIILFSALFLSIALNTAIRCLLRRRRRRRRREDPESGPQPPKPAPSAAALPPPPPAVVFSAETKLGLGNQAECIICLSEFVEGDELRVLIGCGHAFHTQCVHQWLSSHSSCPTCRASYPLPSSSSSSA